MLSLGIRYLNGWAMAAADGARKERAEWPPHPDRVFMALAAAWFESGEDPHEGEALRWLEALPPPQITASDAEPRGTDGTPRPAVSYVPVNDTQRGTKLPAGTDLGKLKDAGLALLPEHRERRPRHFPVVIPHDPTVHLTWTQAEPAERRPALEQLVRKVTHIGHSSSFAQLWLEPNPPAPTWIPVQGLATVRLRISGPGRLDYLEGRCNRKRVIAHADLEARIKAAKGKEKKMLKAELAECFGDAKPVSLRPQAGLWHGYAQPRKKARDEIPGTVFDPRLLVLALAGKRLDLPATLKVLGALRGAILDACPQPIPEWVSGHRPEGGPSADPHLALLPLPFVGSTHADGRLMGVALALPAGLDPAEAGRCLQPLLHDGDGLPRSLQLFDGPWLDCRAVLETRESPPSSLLVERWTAAQTGATTWASVTPVVLDRHFDGKDKWEKAAEGVKDACGRIGLPRPREVVLHPVSLIEGVPHAREFPYLTRKRDGGRMHHVHAVLVFDAYVCGPVVIGAGRFRGYGLCRPVMGGGRPHV